MIEFLRDHASRRRARRQSVRRAEEAARTRPHHDGGCQDRFPRRGRGGPVNRTLLNTLGDAIIRLNKERGYTFCMIEHDMDFIGRLCDPVIVMAEGKS